MGRLRTVKVVGLALTTAGALACGGGSSGAGGQFCHSWATAYCEKVYACTTAADRSPLVGTSQAQCVQIWDAACADPPPSGETFDVNCSGGVHVNTAAKSACLDELSTISCDDFTSPTYVSVCTQVCPSSTGTGGTTGTGGSGTGTGGTGGSGATGGSSGTGGGAPTACGTVEPCGGSPAGTWTLSSECLDPAEVTALVQQELYCTTATVTSALATISGSATFNTNMTFTLIQNLTGTLTFNVPATCTSGLSCADYASYEQLILNDPSFVCTGTTSCGCTQQSTSNSTNSGTYTLSGTDLNLNASTGATATLGYCVQGSTIHLMSIDPTMHTGPGGQATIAKDIVGQKG
jgi:hypothetical protein